ncbi:MAG: efflux transporter outer membrane subunit [Neisseriaceae bacterium]|nr:efflux transporter outer membrane subunit [Neisseriaceae bacterium]
MTFKPHILTAILTASVLSACTMAPTYHRPEVNAPVIDDNNARQANAVRAVEIEWQAYFADPRLKALIDAALQHNTDLRLAVLNADAARAQYGIQRSELFPSIGASGAMTRNRVSQDLSPTGQAYISEQYSVGLGVTAWELDLFGKVRSLNNAAVHNYFAARHTADAAKISIIAAVAKSYFAEKSAQESMDYADKTLKTRQESHRLAEISHKAGVISDIALNQSLSQIEQAKAAYAAAQMQRDAARNALTVLVGGVLPENLPDGKPLTLEAQFNNQIPAGLSSDILTQRPDILSAEEQLKAANAQIGAARAAFFPSIKLTGSGGFATGELDNLFHGTARVWSFSPQINIPIFTWGAVKSGLDLVKVRKEMSIVQYEQAVQNAFRDTSDALNAQKTLSEQAAAQEKIAQATGKVLQLTEMRHQHGVSSSLDLLDAQRQSFAAETALINTRLQQLNNRVDLYKAFGGGVK